MARGIPAKWAGWAALAWCVAVVAPSAARAGLTWWQCDPCTPGDWFDGNHWTAGVPGSDDHAYIDNAGMAVLSSGTGEANCVHVGNSGSGAMAQTGGTHTVSHALDVGYRQGSRGTYELSGDGRLSAENEAVGGSGEGRFTQTGGTNEVTEGLYVGHLNGSTGTYELSGDGQLSADYEFAGFHGDGTFAHSGGTNTVNYLCLGYCTGATGRYELSGDGQLSAYEEHVGRLRDGTFTQTGGTNTVGAGGLFLGYSAGSTGTYVLGGDGQLSADHEYVGFLGEGVFRQTGGTNTASTLYVGHSGPSGTFTQTGGTNTVGMLYVGFLAGSGTFTQTGGTGTVGHLTIGFGVGTTGTCELSGDGQLSAFYECVGYSGNGLLAQSGGTNTVSYLHVGSSAGSEGTYRLGGSGQLSGGSVKVGLEGSGVLDITGAAARAVVMELLHFGSNGAFSAVAGSAIDMRQGADFENESSDPEALAGLGNVRLVFEGDAEDVSSFEVAGTDVGASPGGFEGNFAVGALQLGGAEGVGRIRLVDEFDNRPGEDEALYVLELVLEPGAWIELNGLNLYYLNGGAPKQLFIGDTDLDGDVDWRDYVALKGGFGRLAGEAAWADGDTNGEREVDYQDYAALRANFGAVTTVIPAAVPEPCTLALLAAGALAALSRRRGGRAHSR